MAEKCSGLKCEAALGLIGKYFDKLPVDLDVLRDGAVPPYCKSDPDSAESPVENEKPLLELVAVKTEKDHNRPKMEMSPAENQAYQRRIKISDQRAIRLEKNRLRVMTRRQEETEYQRRIRRQKCAQRASKLRANETEEQRQQRLEECRLRAAERRKNMTPTERELWRLKNRIQTRERRQNEDEIRKMLRRHDNAIRAYLKRSHETDEKRMERRMKDALRAAERRKMETPEERKERLRKDRERVRLKRMERRTAVTPEQNETTRENCSKYCDRTPTMLSILKSIQDHLNYNEIKKQHINLGNINSLMLFVKSRHPDLKEAYVENAVHTFLSSSSRDSDSSGTSFPNDDASLLSMSDCSESPRGESSYYENLVDITEEIDIKQEPLED